ncbi:MAG: hypothetical protein DLM71_03480 [Chloroflexi bacterium]|nr:MAG: hypothetical protein DLM71_03480 [Chloroflexota bacterium]
MAATLAVLMVGCSSPSVEHTGSAAPSPSVGPTGSAAGFSASARPSAALSPRPVAVTARVPLRPSGAESVEAGETVAGFGSLWIPVIGQPHGWLLRVDTSSARVTARIAMGTFPGSVAVAGGSVWVANSGSTQTGASGANTLSRIDPALNRVVQTLPIEIGGRIVAGFGGVFVPGAQVGGGPLRRIDAATGRVVATFPFSGVPAVACGSLWVARTPDPEATPPATVLQRLDAASGKLVQELAVADGSSPPTDADGQCVIVAGANHPDEESAGRILVLGARGVERRSPVLHTFIAPLLGAIWTAFAPGVLQRLDVNGAPVGAPLLLGNRGQGSWTLVQAGEQTWLVTTADALRVTL